MDDHRLYDVVRADGTLAVRSAPAATAQRVAEREAATMTEHVAGADGEAHPAD